MEICYYPWSVTRIWSNTVIEASSKLQTEVVVMLQKFLTRQKEGRVFEVQKHNLRSPKILNQCFKKLP